MKKMIYIAAVALLTMGMVACERNDDDDSDTNNTNAPEGYVNLGLPSGLLWAECNIGATTPEGYGFYYAWGMVDTSSDYCWETYTYGDRNSDGRYTMYKYNTTEMYGTVDNQTTLQSSDDAATQSIGSGARMPTKAEWQELLENTTSAWTSVNGVYGRKFTASNGNSIFLPAAGGRFGEGLDGVGQYGRYWSSSVLESDPYYAWGMGFISTHQDVFDGSRDFGRSIRAVRPATQN